MKTSLFLATALLACFAFGAEHATEAAEHQEIPLKEIGWQAVNLGILLVGLFFAIKDSIKEAFLNRRKHFVEQAEKTKKSLMEAEKSLADIKAKLQILESGEKSSLTKAAQEAELLRANLIKDSEAQAGKLKEDARMVLSAELEKAKMEIGQVILGGAIGATTRRINDKKSQITQAAESEFLKQMGQVKA